MVGESARSPGRSPKCSPPLPFMVLSLLLLPGPGWGAFELRPNQIGLPSPTWTDRGEESRAGVFYFRPYGLSSVRLDGVHVQSVGTVRISRLLASGYEEWMVSVAAPLRTGAGTDLTIETEWLRTQPPEEWPGLRSRQTVVGGLQWRGQVGRRVSGRSWLRELGWGPHRRPLGLSWKAGVGVSAWAGRSVLVSAEAERTAWGRVQRQLEVMGRFGRHLSLGYRWSNGAQTQIAEVVASPWVIGVWRTSYETVRSSLGLRLGWRGSRAATASNSGERTGSGRSGPAGEPSEGTRRVRSPARPVGPESVNASASFRSTWFADKRSDRWRVDLERGPSEAAAGHAVGRTPWVQVRTTVAKLSVDAVWGQQASRSSEVASRGLSSRPYRGSRSVGKGRWSVALSRLVESQVELWSALDPTRLRAGLSRRGDRSSFGIEYSSLYESRFWVSWGTHPSRVRFDLIGQTISGSTLRAAWVRQISGPDKKIWTRIGIQERLGSPPRIGKVSDPTALWRRVDGEFRLRRGPLGARFVFDDRRARTGPEPWDGTRRTTRVSTTFRIRRPTYDLRSEVGWKEIARRARSGDADRAPRSLESTGRGWIRLDRTIGPSRPGLEVGWQERSSKRDRWWGLWYEHRIGGLNVHGALAETWSDRARSVSVPLGGFGPTRQVPSPGVLWAGGTEIRRRGWSYVLRAAGGQVGQDRWGPEVRSALRLRWGRAESGSSSSR